MQARQIMTQPVITVRPDTTIRQAASLLLEHRITAAPVVGTRGELVGIVSEGDLVLDRFGHDPRSQLRPVQEEPPGPQTVAEVMNRTVIVLTPSTDAADLAETMLARDIRSIPIVEGDTVVGIVSRRDLLRTLVRGDDAIRADVTARLDAYGGADCAVEVTDGDVLLVGDLHEADGRAALALARTVPGVASARLERRSGSAGARTTP